MPEVSWDTHMGGHGSRSTSRSAACVYPEGSVRDTQPSALAYSGAPVAKAERRPVTLGTALSVGDDLRIVRSSGGFPAVLAAGVVDLAGTRAALEGRGNGLAEALWMDAFRELRAATEALCTILDETASEGSRASLGSQGVRRLVLNGDQGAFSAAALRGDIGTPLGRSADYVRRAEDDVCDLVGELVVSGRAADDVFDFAFQQLELFATSVVHLVSLQEPERLLFGAVAFEVATAEIVLASDDGERLDLQQAKLLALALLAVESNHLDWETGSLLRMTYQNCVSGEIHEFLTLLATSDLGERTLQSWRRYASDKKKCDLLRRAYEKYQIAARQYKVLRVVHAEQAAAVTSAHDVELQKELQKLSKSIGHKRIYNLVSLLRNDTK